MFALGGGGDAAAADRDARPIIISAFGDSLSAGYQLRPDEGFAPVLQDALQQDGYDVQVINAAISGDTSAGGLARVEWMLRKDPHIVIVELGANDMLRGLPVAALRANLEGMIVAIQQHGAVVVLAGMKAPLNVGVNYSRAFAAVYDDLASDYDLPFYEFFLEGVAQNPALNLSDGLHPNAAGVRKIVRGIQPLIATVIDEQFN